jgi:hypothetical protein
MAKDSQSSPKDKNAFRRFERLTKKLVAVPKAETEKPKRKKRGS